jgi:hypothetical protein
MAAIFKIAYKWFFDHNSVSFVNFCVLFFVLDLHLIEYISSNKKILSDLRWRVTQDGAENQKIISLELPTFLRSVFCNDF